MNDRRRKGNEGNRFIEGCLLALACLVFILAMLFFFALTLTAGTLPASVYVTRSDYHRGQVVTECWLDNANYGAVGSGYGLIVDCHSDIDGIFTNGFDPPFNFQPTDRRLR